MDKYEKKGVVILCSAILGVICISLALDNVILGFFGSLADITIITLISSVGFIFYPSDNIKDKEIREGAKLVTNIVVTLIALGIPTSFIVYSFEEDFGIAALGIYANAWAARTLIAP